MTKERSLGRRLVHAELLALDEADQIKPTNFGTVSILERNIMKNILIAFVMIGASSVVFAAGIKDKALLAAADMKKNEVRTITKLVFNVDGNNDPCMPEGESYQPELQVKKAIRYDHEKNKLVFEWKTVKKIYTDKDGSMEFCAE